MTVHERRRVTVIAGAVLLASVVGGSIALGCGPWLTFRAYLRRSFWQPVRHFSAALATTAPKGGGAVRTAGFSDAPVPKPLAELRAAYQELATEPVRKDLVAAAERAATAALVSGALVGEALEEARLLDAKAAMRSAIDAETGDLAVARGKFEAFLATKPTTAHASEARCWLARVLYKQGDGVAAARVYLEELERPSPVVPAEVLATSVRMVFVAHKDQFWARAEEFFDNPRFALFIVNVLTNPSWSVDGEPGENQSARHVTRVLAALRSKSSLFGAGADSDALAMVLMRVSLFTGDLEGVLRDSQRVSAGAPRKSAEFNWMIASAHYLAGRYAAAEAPLQQMLAAPQATVSDRRTAAQALLAVYLKLNRRVDALHAALLGAAAEPENTLPYFEAEQPRPQWCVSCDTLDLPYLLDATLTAEDLSTYLRTYQDPPELRIPVTYQRTEPARAYVEFALAVRLAREGRYSEAEAIYARLGASVRARRMQTLAGISSRVRDSSLPAAQRLQARFDLAAYLADNPERILFNDWLWRGFQREALVREGRDPRWGPGTGLTAVERDDVMSADRRLQDAQEERWQAFLLLEKVARDAGDSPLARKAALKILDTLVRINTGRFGRADEIDAAIRKWRGRLKTSGRV